MARPESLESYLRRHGPCRVRDLVAAGYQPRDIRALHLSGRIDRLARGIYQVSGTTPENPGYAELFLRSPKAVLCLLSALRFHGITSQLPHEVWIALEKNSRSPSLDYPPLRIVRFSGEAFTQGIETHSSGGIAIRVYSVAKTVADMFKMRNTVGLDAAMETLREALASRKANRADIVKMAAVCRMENVMRPYLEMEAGP